MLATMLIVILLACATCAQRRELLPWDKMAVLPLRGLLVLLVVLGHSFDAMGWRGFSMAYPAVSVFLFISGYGLMRKRLLAPSSPPPWWIVNAFCKLMPIYMIVSLIYSMVLICCGREVKLLENIIAGSSSLPIPFAWYIPATLALYSIFFLSDRLCRRGGSLVLCVGGGVIAYWLLTAVVFRWPFYWWKAIGGFVSGSVFALYEHKIRNLLNAHFRLAYCVAALCLLVAVAFSSSGLFLVRFAAEHLALVLIGPAVALVMFVRPVPLKRLFEKLGRVSYEVYVVHGIFVCWLWPVCSDRMIYLVGVLGSSFALGSLLHWGRVSWNFMRASPM